MAEMIIQNPSITPNVFEYDEAGRVSAISGYPLAGGGGGTIVKSDLMWKPSVESDGYVHWTLASSATSPEAAYISGAQGPAGPQGEQGPSGAKGDTGEKGDKGDDATPITATTATIAGGTQVTISYTSGGDPLAQFNILSGAQGASGTNGKDGISPTVSTSAIPGGNRVIFTYDDDGTTKTESIDVMSGVSGAPGANGVSPTVTITDAPTATQHPQGGKTVTITDADHPTGQSFDIWNGINGEGATVNLLDGNGIHITNDGIDYTIGVSADYALKSELPDVTDMATKTWVEEQGYLTSIPNTYALKTDVEAASANAYDKAVAQIPDVTNFITKDVNNLTYYYEKNEADGRYQKKSDMGSYLTTAQYETDSATFVTSSNLVITGDAQYALTTSGWEKVQGGVSTVETNNYVSGDGTIQYPIGLSAEAASAIDAMSDQYQIDGGQYVSVVPNSTTHKVVVGLDNQATNAIADVIASANIWDKASAVSTKSHVTIDNTTNIITTENQGTSASLSAVEYKDNVNVAGMNIQQIYAVRNDGDIFACLSTTANKGTLFFVCSGV